MKTLYIDINNQPIQETDEVKFFSDNGKLQNAFFYELGSSLLSKSGINVPKAQLISEFSNSGNDDAYNKIVSQWNVLKAILFGEDVEGVFEVRLPKEYMLWLSRHQNQDYRDVCRNKKYDCTKELVIVIDVEDFYDEYVNDDFKRDLVVVLRDNGDIGQMVFDDNIVTRKSLIVTEIRNEFKELSFIPYENFSGPKASPKTGDGDNNRKKQKCFKYAIQEVADDYYSIIECNGDIVLDDIEIYNNGFALSNGRVYRISNEKGIEELMFDGHHALSIKYDSNIRPFLQESLTICVLDNGKVIIFDENQNVLLNRMFDDAKYDGNETVLIKECSRWGVYDSKSKEYIITPQYNDMNSLYRGRYAASKLIGREQRWGVINNSNQELYPFENDEITEITIQKEYTCLVLKHGSKYGVVKYDSDGKCEIIPFEYSHIEHLFDLNEEERGESYFRCDNSGTTVIDSDGYEVIPETDDIGFINVRESQIIAEPTDDECEDIIGEIKYCPSNRTSSGIMVSGCSVLNSKWDTIYESSYDKYLHIVDDKFIVEESNIRGLEKDTFKIIDIKGRVLCSKDGRWIQGIGNDLFAFGAMNGNTLIIDKLGRIKYDLGKSDIPIIFDDNIYFIEPTRKNTSVMKSIDTSENIGIVMEFDSIYRLGRFVKQNLVELYNDDLKGLFNIQTKEMIFNFDSWDFVDREDYFEVRTMNGRMYYDLNGNKINFNNDGNFLWVL